MAHGQRPQVRLPGTSQEDDLQADQDCPQYGEELREEGGKGQVHQEEGQWLLL